METIAFDLRLLVKPKKINHATILVIPNLWKILTSKSALFNGVANKYVEVFHFAGRYNQWYWSLAAMDVGTDSLIMFRINRT